MQAKEEQEKLLKWFILPNESYKWDFILENIVVEDSQHEVSSEKGGLNNSLTMALTKIMLSRTRNEKSGRLLLSGRAYVFLAAFFIIRSERHIAWQSVAFFSSAAKQGC